MPQYSPRRRAGRAGAAGAAALALVLGLPTAATAAPGNLDSAFSGDGKVVTDVTGYENVSGMAVQPDGKIITVGDGYFDETSGDFVLVRHNADGSLDTTFGGDGIVNTDFDFNNDEARALALQPDGKIIAVGGSTSIAGYGDWVAARYNPDGSLDPTFGTGGRAVTDIDPDAIETAMTVAVRPDGRIVAAGQSLASWVVVRWNANGSLDPTFDGDGKAVTTFPGGTFASAADLALQPDGRVVVAGAGPGGVTLARYNTDGSLDPTFDGDGRAAPGFGARARGVALQSDGRIVVATGDDNVFGLARFTAGGAVDPTFGSAGRVTTSFGPDIADAADVALQSDGRIVVAGRYAGDWALARYNTNGAADTSFDGDGRLTTDFGGPSEQASQVALQADGKIVAGGVVGQANSLAADRGVARYLGGGGTTPPPPSADLSVTKSGTATVSIGDQATYTVRVTNAASSTATATGVSLTDALSGAGGALISAVPSQGTCSTTATGATCALGSLAPGASATVTVTAEPRTTGTLRDTASVTGSPQDPNTGDNSATATTSVNNARGCTIVGTSGTDTLTGGYGNDVICALSGNDTVRAGYGNDTVHGGPGNDNLDGGFGDDTMNGDRGNDVLTGYYGNDRLTTTDGVSANDTANGGSGVDTCTTDSGDTRISCP
ncbi:calcium-binding protein [Streptomyces virginiae]|uniref:calcium-binding protein n=1 Tax=Streptomyces virginiae TaxID=1961 RepID=UPI0036B4BB0F